MEPISVSEIITATGGQLLGSFDQSVTISEVDTDSRNMHGNSLFIPLAGENFDGHIYIPSALESGALGCLTEKPVEPHAEGKFYILVKDTMKALGDLARYYRSKFYIKVVGVTGSVGKTTTKDMIASVLSEKYSVLKTEGNYNNNIGVPKTLFRLNRTHEIAVVEMGMNHRGEIDYLTHIAKPDLAVITNVGDAHIENLGSRENTLQAKAEIFSSMAPEGVAVLNGDDPLVSSLKDKLIHPVILCGEGEDCDFRCTDIREGEEDTMLMDAITPDGSLHAVIHCLGRHMYHPALAAAAVGSFFGMNPEEIRKGIESFAPTKMRMGIIRAPKGITILNDTYNANPQSMRAAVDVLSKYSGAQRIAVLGDMLELGDLGDVLHESVGRFVGQSGIDCLVTVGELGASIAKGAREAGMTEVYDRPNKEEAKVVLAQVMKPESTILCKASRGMKFEELTDYLKRLAESE